MDVGSFSISLAVKDIIASKEFYNNLGFEMVDGTIDQKWCVLKNGSSKIGLFQGMFPANTLTFAPDNARKLYQHMKTKKIKIGISNGMDTKKGPASFMINDPDGNPILIDQH
ncbi:VOC family protein [Aquimarina sp. 2201CG14-23]|nr:VOC family protein [Aquimarina sp. 2201CG14-23]MDH7447130.1 VOC family protein [Aquimarina sp. 2201CG14-23]